MTGLGHNKPPEMLELARETTRQISEWYADNPVVTTEEEARKIKLHIDRAKLCLRDLEDDRDKLVRPLNERVAQINLEHRKARQPLGAVLDAMLGASDAYLKAEEAKRIEAANEATRLAHEAEENARRAEALEQSRIDDARQGEVGVDIAAITEQADMAFQEYAAAERAAIRAKAETHVKLFRGLGRSMALRDKENLQVDDPIAAIQDMGLVENVRLALLTAARAFRRMHNRLPNGIGATIERVLR